MYLTHYLHYHLSQQMCLVIVGIGMYSKFKQISTAPISEVFFSLQFLLLMLTSKYLIINMRIYIFQTRIILFSSEFTNLFLKIIMY